MTAAGILTRVFEQARLRGAPTILANLSKIPTLRNRTATVTLPGGAKISFPAYDQYWCRYLYAGVPYEPDVERLFHAFGKGRVLVDCGANIGYWSVRHKEFGFTDAIAIEANPRLIPFLERNHEGRVIHAAVHSKSGETLLLGRDGAQGTISDSGVPVRSLALADLGITGPALVKLDVEGSEIPAIEGAGDMDAIFLYEDWPTRNMEVTAFLLERGYKILSDSLAPVTSIEQAASIARPHGPANLLAMR